jgi:hypothetical protein
MYWRQYTDKHGNNESRAHLSMHREGFFPGTDYVDLPGSFPHPGLPGYVHSTSTLVPLSLRLFPTVKYDVLPLFKEFECLPNGDDEFYWNGTIDALLFRTGSERIGRHSDSTQGEQQIVTLIAECNHERIVSFTPKNAFADDPTLPEFDLCLRTGDVYEMDGKLQKIYNHSVQPSAGKHDYERRLVLVFRRGYERNVCHDSGSPLKDLYPIARTWQYTTANPPGLVEGCTYKFGTLRDMKLHRYVVLTTTFCPYMPPADFCAPSFPEKCVCGNEKQGCHAIKLDVAALTKWKNSYTLLDIYFQCSGPSGSKALWTNYVGNKPVRFFYCKGRLSAAKSKALWYRYDGFYSIVGVTMQDGDGATAAAVSIDHSILYGSKYTFHPGFVSHRPKTSSSD